MKVEPLQNSRRQFFDFSGTKNRLLQRAAVVQTITDKDVSNTSWGPRITRRMFHGMSSRLLSIWNNTTPLSGDLEKDASTIVSLEKLPGFVFASTYSFDHSRFLQVQLSKELANDMPPELRLDKYPIKPQVRQLMIQCSREFQIATRWLMGTWDNKRELYIARLNAKRNEAIEKIVNGHTDWLAYQRKAAKRFHSPGLMAGYFVRSEMAMFENTEFDNVTASDLAKAKILFYAIRSASLAPKKAFSDNAAVIHARHHLDQAEKLTIAEIERILKEKKEGAPYHERFPGDPMLWDVGFWNEAFKIELEYLSTKLREIKTQREMVEEAFQMISNQSKSKRRRETTNLKKLVYQQF